MQLSISSQHFTTGIKVSPSAVICHFSTGIHQDYRTGSNIPRSQQPFYTGFKATGSYIAKFCRSSSLQAHASHISI